MKKKCIFTGFHTKYGRLLFEKKNNLGLNLLRKYALSVLVLVLVITSCSRKNDSFVSRNFHAVTTEYNTLFNGDTALDQGKEALILNFQDNYWDILPVERIAFEENTDLGDENRDPNFEKAEEKAIKAIQRHSMKIDGEERNPQIDEAFMLLGKARYYDQQFVPALEAFNYILAYYPKSDNIAQAKVWKEKTNIRLENNELAIENLEKIFKVEKKLKDQDIADATAMLAQAYLNLEKPGSTLIYMKKAVALTRKNEEKGRYNYIIGQLYNKLEHKDSANMAFQKVIDLNRKIPRKYHVNAHLEQIRNFDYTIGDTLALRERLDKLVENRENRPYLDKIYYTKAAYFMQLGKEDSAIANYNKSLRQNGADTYLVSRDYLALADYNFDNASYKLAGAYYDSVIGKLDDKTREYRLIRKKRENLTDVIDYENLTIRNDSILALATLSEDSLTAYFEKYIADQKAKAVADSIARVEEIRNNEFFTSTSRKKSSAKIGEFYFYNATAVSFGKQAFEKQWGKRRLEDGWRLSSRQASSSNPNEIPGLPVNQEEKVVALTAADYVATIPREPKQVDSLKQERDFAYYQLGLIYKEKFKEYPLAASRLERLLTLDPQEKLILPSKYNLYQVYKAMGVASQSDNYKNDITGNYPESRYAALLNNPNTALEADQEAPEVIYKNLYKQFQNQEYVGLLTELDRRIDLLYGDEYVPKFELLKATVKGRLEGYDSYKKALNYVALTYPRSTEGKQAQKMLQTSLPSMFFRSFDDEVVSTSYKVVYEFNNTDLEGAKDFKKKLEEGLEEVNYTQFTTSLDTYTKDKYFVIVHYLESRSQAEGLVELLATNPKIVLSRENTIIASENYRIIQLHKNLEAYKTQTTK